MIPADTCPEPDQRGAYFSRLLDDEFEGKEEWVSPARPNVLWTQADQWLAEERWLAVLDASAKAVDSVEHRAASMVFDGMAPRDIVDIMVCYRHAVLTVRDREAFRRAVGLDAADLVEAPGYVIDDGTVVAPWPALLTAARRVALCNAPEVLAESVVWRARGLGSCCPVAVTGHRHGLDPQVLDPVRREQPPPIRADEVAAELSPTPAVACPQQVDQPPPGEGVQLAEGVFGYRVFEVVGPAAHQLTQFGQQSCEAPLRCPVCQGTDLRLHRP
jgi:hypothetical protein